tara:strand:- start:69 stop:245 length:177 start_codon:yes stop_codon:yes gene_type:complete
MMPVVASSATEAELYAAVLTATSMDMMFTYTYYIHADEAPLIIWELSDTQTIGRLEDE